MDLLSSLHRWLETAFYFIMRFSRKYLPIPVVTFVGHRLGLIGRNCGTLSSSGVYSLYAGHLGAVDPEWMVGRTILEIGIGATNSSCYELAARGAAICYAFEPFVPLNEPADEMLKRACSVEHGMTPDSLEAKVSRVTETAHLPAGSMDLILSNSVLEHVTGISALATELRRLLKEDGGYMLHIVDYREHYFKYPYHHLLWSRDVWDAFLNPGDLPRWRISDHVRAFREVGFDVQILRASALLAEFAKIRDRVHPSFRSYPEDELAVAFGVLLIR